MYLKYPDFLESFEMHKEGDLSPELAGHHVHDGLLLQGRLVRPEVVKPLQHPHLNIARHFSANIYFYFLKNTQYKQFSHYGFT